MPKDGCLNPGEWPNNGLSHCPPASDFSSEVATAPESAENRLDRAPAALFKRVRQLQYPRFAERRTKNLQSDRQLAADFAARHRNPRNTSERARDRINVRQVHLQRIV